MTKKEIIDGLKFTVEMFLFDPASGEKFTEPRNDMDKTTIDACRGAIELLEPDWIPVSERLPDKTGLYLTSIGDLVTTQSFDGHNFRTSSYVKFVPDAWMDLPKSYKSESGDKCKNCKYYRNPDYTRCHKCEAERSE